MRKVLYRDLFEEPVIGQITQGSIFNGAKSRAYPNNLNVMGIIISPRCDIEQQKAPLYYFLPVVRVTDWLLQDMPNLYIPRLEEDAKNILKHELIKNGESETILDKFDATYVEQRLRLHSPQLKKNVEDRLEIWKALETYRKGSPLKTVTIKDESNIQKGIFDELIANKNPNFYFLEHEHEEGYVIRMREISRLAPEMLFRLAKGIEGKLTDSELEDSDLRQLDPEELIMPLYVVKSPFMEHIMQHFLQQFNRIGIEDVHKDFSNRFIELIKNNQQ